MATIRNTRPFILGDYGGGAFNITPKAAETWEKGSILAIVSGLAELAVDGSKLGLCLAAAKYPDAEYQGTQGPQQAYSLKGCKVAMQVKTGDVGASHVLVQANIGASYGISVDAAGYWYVNVADTTDVAVKIIGTIGDAKDNTGYGKVGDTNVVCEVQFLDVAVAA